MENASKALLIAGSVLIVILLIVVGMRIVNSTTGTTETVQSTMDVAAVSAFNNKFLAYAGSNKSAFEIRSLINTVISTNATNGTKIVISLKDVDGSTINTYGYGYNNFDLLYQNLSSSTDTYAVKLHYYTEGTDTSRPTVVGYVYTIDVITEEKNN